MSATHAAIVFALEPVFTALFAAMFLGERLSGRDLAGAPRPRVVLGIVSLRVRREVRRRELAVPNVEPSHV